MKPIYYFLAAFILVLSSCGIVSEEFSRQKYTGFKRGGGNHVAVKESPRPNPVNKGVVNETSFSTKTTTSDVDVPKPNATNSTEVSKVQYDQNSVLKEEKSNSMVLDRTLKPTTFTTFKKSTSSADDGCNGILMILLCIFLPPVAIYIVEKTTVRFWIALICCLVSGVALGGMYYWSGLWLVSIILAFMAYLGS